MRKISIRTIFLLLFIVAVLLRPPLLKAQSDSSSSPLAQDGSIILHDAGSVISSPFHWHEQQFINAGAVIGGTLALFTADKWIRMNAQLPRIHTPTDDAIASFGNNYGSPQYGLALTGVLYAGGLIDHNPSLRDDGVMLLESLGFAGAVTTVGKTIIGRARPYTEEGIASFTPLSFNTEHTSLPSGHTTVAFSVSTILAEEIGNTYASIALYGIAGITVYARVYTDEHWVSDTFLGAAIGTTSGILVYHLHHHDGDGSSEASLHITPSLNGVDVALIF